MIDDCAEFFIVNKSIKNQYSLYERYTQRFVNPTFAKIIKNIEYLT